MNYAITSEEAKQQVAHATSFDWLINAGAVLAAVGTDCGVMTNGHRSDTVDLSIAMSFAMLQATELGLGTCWIAHYEEPALRKILALPDEYSVGALLSVGYSAEQQKPRLRKPIEKIIRIHIESLVEEKSSRGFI